MTDTPASLPPRIARVLLHLLTPTTHSDLLGDLQEGFASRVERQGLRAARRWYWRQLLSLDLIRLRFVPGPSAPAPLEPHKPEGHADMLLHHLRQAYRSLRARPALAAGVVLTLGIGIGANTAVFSVVHGVLLKPLPYADPGRLVMVFRTVPRFGFVRSTASVPDYSDWRDQASSFASLSAYAFVERTYLNTTGASRWQGFAVTAGLFPMLGVTPLHGRGFSAEDDRPGSPATVILSHATWRETFAADPGVVGTTVSLDGAPVTVVGIMPPEFDFPSRTAAFWIPLQADPGSAERDSNFLTVIGRLREGVTAAGAQDELSTLAARIDAEAPDGNHGAGIFVEPRHAFVVRDARTALLVFQGAVGLVLLLTCANVTNLMLSRATSRRREFAVRGALGASRALLLRQLLVESGVLAFLGGSLGIGGAAAALALLRRYGPGQLPRLESVGLDPVVLGVTALLTLGCAMLCGIAPALFGARTSPAQTMKEGEGGHLVMGRLGQRARECLVVAQVAMAVVLGIGAGLLLNSFLRLTASSPGFDPAHVVAGRVTVPRPEMERPENEAKMLELVRAISSERTAFFVSLRTQIEALPGVQRSALAYGLPFGANSFSRRALPEGMTPVEGEDPVIPGNVVDEGYFAVLGIPVRAGRGFEAGDRMEDPPVVVVNQILADRFWPGHDPLGKRLRIGNGDGPLHTVIGVVGNVRERSLAEEPGPMMYTALAQTSWPDAMYLVTRSSTSPDDLVPLIRRELWSLNPALPLTEVTTASDLVDQVVTVPRFRTALLVTFGVIAGILALAGVYGVMAYSVGARLREIGIRLALGAQGVRVLRSVLWRGLILAGLGLAIGSAAALVLTRFLAGMFYGVSPTDAATFGLTGLGVLGAALFASYLPASRAARVDPLEYLRHE